MKLITTGFSLAVVSFALMSAEAVASSKNNQAQQPQEQRTPAINSSTMPQQPAQQQMQAQQPMQNSALAGQSVQNSNSDEQNTPKWAQDNKQDQSTAAKVGSYVGSATDKVVSGSEKFWDKTKESSKQFIKGFKSGRDKSQQQPDAGATQQNQQQNNGGY